MLTCPGRDSNPIEAIKNYCQVVRLPHIASFLREFSSRPGQPSTAASESKPRRRAALGQHGRPRPPVAQPLNHSAGYLERTAFGDCERAIGHNLLMRIFLNATLAVCACTPR